MSIYMVIYVIICYCIRYISASQTKISLAAKMATSRSFLNFRGLSLYLVGTSSFRFSNKFTYLNVWSYTTLQVDVIPRDYSVEDFCFT